MRLMKKGPSREDATTEEDKENELIDIDGGNCYSWLKDADIDDDDALLAKYDKKGSGSLNKG